MVFTSSASVLVLRRRVGGGEAAEAQVSDRIDTLHAGTVKEMDSTSNTQSPLVPQLLRKVTQPTSGC